MTIIYNTKKQKRTRRKLRKDSTKSERIMWERLRNRQLGVKFRRQYGIGNYIADFCCTEKKLVVEIDGEIHEEKDQIYYDKERTKVLEELGFQVMRFKNKEIENNLEEVVNSLYLKICKNK